MKIHCLENRTADGYTTFGSCWKKGEAKTPSFILYGTDGKGIPVQSKPMAFWPDGSIKWGSHTADAKQMARGACLLPFPESATPSGGIHITEEEQAYLVENGILSLTIPKADAGLFPAGDCLAKNLTLMGNPLIRSIFPVFILERHTMENEVYHTVAKEHHASIHSVTIEEQGPLQAVFCFHGCHVQNDSCTMPFILRMYLWKDSAELKFVHTFLFDGKEERDYLKGMGIRFETALSGPAYQHHIQILRQDGVFHEAGQILDSRRPRLNPSVLKAQLDGTLSVQAPSGSITDMSAITDASADLPVWNHYHLHQDSAAHYAIWKRTRPGCCFLKSGEGHRSPGVMAVTGESGGLLLGIRDFWQKYPGGLAVDSLGEKNSFCTAWFYSPMSPAFDFRHYDTKSYPETCYEGFKEVGASAYGIGVTSECRIQLVETLPSSGIIHSFASRLQKPPVFVAEPEYYHSLKAFGYWSLPSADTVPGRQLEAALDRAFAFYRREVECRSWYGLFDYGDFMHSYDSIRHTWKYDVGGFAWQNTELVPTYWLWLYFLHTGREDVFTLAEAMSRHTSEVDIYHFGPLKGLGSRHNVRHWGCSCKEPRIAMAGHHRFLFYLTGDARLGDVMEDVKDADLALCQNPHNTETLPDNRTLPVVRSGPDWSSFVSNWMTHYERTLDAEYLRKIETGISDIFSTPYGFASGPDYYYDASAAHLIYHGEIEETPNQHLQICMGGPQIWLETADMINDDRLKELLTRLGEFYFLPSEKKSRLTGGKIKERAFSWPMFATAVSAYSAASTDNNSLAQETWEVLMETVPENAGNGGFYPLSYIKEYPDDGFYQEISTITTNWVAQWCLNVIMCLEFIPDALPEKGFDVLTKDT